jgi:hypothetical protein
MSLLRMCGSAGVMSVSCRVYVAPPFVVGAIATACGQGVDATVAVFGGCG